MKPLECEQERMVRQAVRSGVWTDDLRSHVAGCAVCSDAVLVAEFFRTESQAARPAHPLPDAGQVWWKAELRARREAAERATRPIAVVQLIGAIAAAMSLVVLAVWRGADLPSFLGQFAAAPAGLVAELTLILTLFSVVAVAAGVSYMIFAER